MKTTFITQLARSRAGIIFAVAIALSLQPNVQATPLTKINGDSLTATQPALMYKINNESVTKDFDTDNTGILTISIADNATLKGMINTSGRARAVTLSIGKSAKWSVTGTSYITKLNDNVGVSGSSILNIVGNGNTVYYDESDSANAYLMGRSYSLQNGGSLSPKNTSVIAKETFFPPSWELHQNYPNPFNPSTTFSFSLQEASSVSLKIYDITGREVATIVNGQFESGTYTYSWNAGSLASGTYIYRIVASPNEGGSKHAFTQSKKFILMK